MKTIVTHVHLKPGAGRDWDAVMRKRLCKLYFNRQSQASLLPHPGVTGGA
jgi:hypothetical protein